MKILKTISSVSEHDTIEFAGELARILQPDDVVLMEGDLGTGKTFLVKQICKIWQTKDEAASPSFAIIHQYNGRQPVYHFDLYRIEDVRELDNLGWEEFLTAGAVTFIEWPQIIEDQLRTYYKVEIQFDNGKRIFKLKQAG